MPNYCSNNTSFSHENPEMIKRVQVSASEDRLFEEFVPNPTGEWDYLWSVENWGTKWNPTYVDITEVSDNKISMMFDTAWSPPIGFYDKMTELGFVVDCRYHETGVCLAGHYTSDDGDDSYSYDFSDENWRDEIDNDYVLDMLEAEYEIFLQSDEEETTEL